MYVEQTLATTGKFEVHCMLYEPVLRRPDVGKHARLMHTRIPVIPQVYSYACMVLHLSCKLRQPASYHFFASGGCTLDSFITYLPLPACEMGCIYILCGYGRRSIGLIIDIATR
jgi:hypothetical protein